MAEKTGIAWTDAVWNPVTGCTKISAGCEHCYAETMTRRLTAMGSKKYAAGFDRVVCHGSALNEPLRWNKRRRVFVCSMSDLFHDDVPRAFIDQVFAIIAISPRHTFQILTKRPKRMAEYIFHPGTPLLINMRLGGTKYEEPLRLEWPLPNVWVGVTAENQEMAHQRIPFLLEVPAVCRFVSMEPLLGPVVPWYQSAKCKNCDRRIIYGITSDDITPTYKYHVHHRTSGPARCTLCGCRMQLTAALDWVIVGGESGPGFRPMDLQWARDVRDQCRLAGVPLFFKQSGGAKPGMGAELDGELVQEFPKAGCA